MTNSDLQHLQDRLKSGDYSGSDVNAAWVAVRELLLRRAICNEAADVLHEVGTWEHRAESVADAWNRRSSTRDAWAVLVGRLQA